MKIALAALALTGLAFAQVRTTADSTPTAEGNVPIYRVTVTSRTAQAVNYRHRGGATKVNFQGTVVAQQSRGEAKVESKKGYIEVEVEFDDLPAPQKLGPEYLTYVMWAISPEGRATNMGEILLNSEGEGKLNVTTELQSFGMIVTAEPYFAVTQPSDMVVMENVVRRDTLGKTEVIDAKYELLKRGSYPNRPAESALRNLPGDPSKTPIYLWEARNAVQIARGTGADKYAAESFRKAEDQLRQAEDYHRRKQEKPTSMVAREAVQTAEDARLIALQRQEEERLAQERAAAAEREAAERARADEARRQRELAEQQTKLAEQQARLEAERRAAADAQRQAAVTERMAAERAKAEADQARLAAERAQQEALTQQQALAAQAAQARQAAQDAERARASAEAEKQQLRDQLRQQLNMVLETRESARGLIVNMSDVLFDFGKYTLRPGTREKLARVSGILLTHPSLRIEVEGHTDNVGSDEFNQKLSEQRASTVREYLVGNGVPANMITAKGLGEATPVTTNDTAQGRQQNRRVELVVSGEAIGTGQQPSATLR
ncbi:MAG TPA: OmpA family protein [Bryobacteraceae bacterium]|nr:OmpA family protein [Bryobacteraceae bacterium]